MKYWEIIIIFLLFLVSLLVRIRFAMPALMGEQVFVGWDDLDYYRLSISLIQNGTLENIYLETIFKAYRMPLFPMMLAVIYSIFGQSPQIAYPFLILLGALTVIGTYFLGKLVFNPMIGIVAALLICFDFSLIFYNRIIHTETLFIFLTLLSMISLEFLMKKKHWTWSIITGVLFGLSILTRPNLILFIPLVIMWIYLNMNTHKKLVVLNILIFSCAIGCIWISWVFRNFLELGAFIPFTTQAGGTYAGIYNDITSNSPKITDYGYWVNIPLPDFTGDLNEVDFDRWGKTLAMTWIAEHPKQAILISLMQFIHLWKPERGSVLDINYFLIILASIIGFVRAIRHGNKSVILWSLMIGSLSFMALLTVGLQRYRLVSYPYLAILAANAFVLSGKKLNTKWKLSSIFSHDYDMN